MKGEFRVKLLDKTIVDYSDFNDIPDIIYDGIIDETLLNVQEDLNPLNICIENNGNATFLNLDASNNFKNMSLDMTPFKCNLPHINHKVY